MPEFLLHDHDFIPLDKLLKITGIVESDRTGVLTGKYL